VDSIRRAKVLCDLEETSEINIEKGHYVYWSLLILLHVGLTVAFHISKHGIEWCQN
jgi:hypothetical protein